MLLPLIIILKVESFDFEESFRLNLCSRTAYFKLFFYKNQEPSRYQLKVEKFNRFVVASFNLLWYYVLVILRRTFYDTWKKTI